jgi:hypothetical protein
MGQHWRGRAIGDRAHTVGALLVGMVAAAVAVLVVEDGRLERRRVAVRRQSRS